MGHASAHIVMVFLLTVPSIASGSTKRYHFVSLSLNWTDAQRACRDDFSDLATIENPADVKTLLSQLSNHTGTKRDKAWIGLHDDLEHSWKWSLSDWSFYGEGERAFRNWYGSRPNNLNGQQYCVELFPESPYFGTWGDTVCSALRYCVCYNGTVNGTAAFVRSSTLFNWTEAQTFCRQNYVDLASVRNQTENDLIAEVADGSFVWIGLHRQPVWSDGSDFQFASWAAGQPDSGEQQCVAAALGDYGRWSDEKCSLALPFICYTTGTGSPSGFRLAGQDEMSVTLQWNKLTNSVSFILQFDDTETLIQAPDGDQPVTYTVSSLAAASVYTFTLYFVFEDSRSTGVTLTALTAPLNPENFRAVGQNGTSITLGWSRYSNSVGFILQFDDRETPVAASDEDELVTFTVSSLSPATKYSFTLFSVFGNIRSTGITLEAFTYPFYVLSLDLKLESFQQLTHAYVLNSIEKILRQYGVSAQDLSVKILKIQSM